MTDKIDDGGPAFPCMPGGEIMREQYSGMSLRDWFAGQALVGFLANGSQRLVAKAVEESEAGQNVADTVALAAIVNTQIAGGCFALADAMLAERKK